MTNGVSLLLWTLSWKPSPPALCIADVYPDVDLIMTTRVDRDGPAVSEHSLGENMDATAELKHRRGYSEVSEAQKRAHLRVPSGMSYAEMIFAVVALNAV
ncbi:hypothetical protein AbraIFM66951_011933 [Aspergillus brasiliensis]|uniref:Uncharacterized protein n=1 Tax=Aspergillus brasiliensis TaxID=319629 RepID=A0A9W5YXA9_9EURO|nr:hypothetical protein AbraCBS73388_011653 [Aspergillus brasiliensis]GKZ48175.1 hypothetical protein AbraIFM66951_011933 [Aspergillus brasiliensis]